MFLVKIPPCHYISTGKLNFPFLCFSISCPLGELSKFLSIATDEWCYPCFFPFISFCNKNIKFWDKLNWYFTWGTYNICVLYININLKYFYKKRWKKWSKYPISCVEIEIKCRLIIWANEGVSRENCVFLDSILHN